MRDRLCGLARAALRARLHPGDRALHELSGKCVGLMPAQLAQSHMRSAANQHATKQQMGGMSNQQNGDHDSALSFGR